MGDKTEIEWADATWSITYGCTKISPGCANCYIERTPPYRMKGLKFEKGAIPIQTFPDRLEWPLRWKRPRRIFVDSLSDLFHPDVPFDFIDRVFAVMAMTPRHTFQVLTKRPGRMREYMTAERTAYFSDGEKVTPRNPYHSADFILWAGQKMVEEMPWDLRRQLPEDSITADSFDWPLPNVWLGVTVENQRWANERIPILLDTPAAVRYLSMEPLLGKVSLRNLHGRLDALAGVLWERPEEGKPQFPQESVAGLSWVIAGGESAGPAHRALVHRQVVETYDVLAKPRAGSYVEYPPKRDALEWVRQIRDQCVQAGVPFLFKQWGGPTPKSAGRDLDGRTWDEFPDA